MARDDDYIDRREDRVDRSDAPTWLWILLLVVAFIGGWLVNDMYKQAQFSAQQNQQQQGIGGAGQESITPLPTSMPTSYELGPTGPTGTTGY